MKKKYDMIDDEVLEWAKEDECELELDVEWCVVYDNETYGDHCIKGYDSKSEMTDDIRTMVDEGQWEVLYVYHNQNPVEWSVRTEMIIDIKD